ncbi:MAG: NAD-dependent epimerase/dehydratase family protein [bacterium]|nr:NAD-dependent epimerase/dehydratase family protein [bacterium]
MTGNHIFVTGGAGYIGSHTVRELLRMKYAVIVYDDLSEGHREFVPDDAVFIQGNTGDKEQLERVFNRYPVDTVVHFAGFISMGESMRNPARYFHNNVGDTLVLLESMVRHDILKIVFSSSAGVYGNPVHVPIEEGDRTAPTNPYGESKLMIENCLKWYDICHGMKSISIRYFNAAGASPEPGLGEAHRDESHIIPLAILTALGRRGIQRRYRSRVLQPGDYRHGQERYRSELSRGNRAPAAW